jgi:probable phosphoglycerate mutase
MGVRLLYLVRHGEYADDGTGQDDGPLTEVGVQQSTLVGERLAGAPFAAVFHSPTRRATQTTELIAARLAGVPVKTAEELADFLPTGPDPEVMSPFELRFLATATAEELADGPARAAAALERFAGPTGTDGDVRELAVTHNWVISWLVACATGVRSWLTLNHYHCGITVIAYRPDRPASLVSYNDVGHLPPALRGLEFPDALRV